jgi:hypothetical protein
MALSNAQLVTDLNKWASAGVSRSSKIYFLQPLGYTIDSATAQLKTAGFSSRQIEDMLNSTGSFWSRFKSWGVALPGPGIVGGFGVGAEAGAGAAGAEAGAAGAGAGAASTAANIGKSVLGALTVSSLFTNIGLWKGLGMVVAGAVLVLIGILNLAGVDPGTVAKRVV